MHSPRVGDGATIGSADPLICPAVAQRVDAPLVRDRRLGAAAAQSP